MSPAPKPRRVPLGQSWRWISGGWRLVMRKPLTWIVFTIITWTFVSAAAVHPIVFALVGVFLPVLLAGWFKACVNAEAGRSIPVTMLFDGFRSSVRDLAAIGGVNMMTNLVLMLVMLALGGDLLTQAMREPESLSAEQATVLRDRMSVALVIVAGFGLPMALAAWFAPAGVTLDGQRGFEALIASLRAILRNALAFGLYVTMLVCFAMGLVTLLTMAGLARVPAMEFAFWLLMPLLVTSVYVSYRDIYPLPAAAGDAPEPDAPSEAP